jgi:hypothetical protein
MTSLIIRCTFDLAIGFHGNICILQKEMSTLKHKFYLHEQTHINKKTKKFKLNKCIYSQSSSFLHPVYASGPADSSKSLSKPGQSKLELPHKIHSVLSSAYILQHFLNGSSLFSLWISSKHPRAIRQVLKQMPSWSYQMVLVEGFQRATKPRIHLLNNL